MLSLSIFIENPLFIVVFLDASKAFDRVNHKILFQLLLKRNLPVPILRFLLSWYQSQSLSVRWNSTFSTSFGVSNGVRQGGVLSPLLFVVYIDEPLIRLNVSEQVVILAGCSVLCR